MKRISTPIRLALLACAFVLALADLLDACHKGRL